MGARLKKPHQVSLVCRAGLVHIDDQYDTMQALSHFSYHQSDGEHIVGVSGPLFVVILPSMTGGCLQQSMMPVWKA